MTLPTRVIPAAGAVVFRPGREVLLVHRPKYDDWSFPKGKLDPGELLPACAVREVQEETGLRIALGRPLSGQRYATSKGDKVVSYWVARVPGGAGADDVSGYEPNDEIDEVAWLPADKAMRRLSYSYDRATLREALSVRRRTRTVVVVRHADAVSRTAWRDDDRLRPLLPSGRQQAQALAPVLAAYGVSRLVSSTSTRCVETLEPFAESADVRLTTSEVLSEEGAGRKRVRALVRELVDGLDRAREDAREAAPVNAGAAALCTHRPVLPWVLDALGVEQKVLGKGDALVAHLRHGKVVAVEQHTLA